MTRLMKEAIQKLQSLPEDKQDVVADFVLNELEDDRKWDESSMKHARQLRQLADEAAEDLRMGRTSELNPESL